jgi:hypothetical protein
MNRWPRTKLYVSNLRWGKAHKQRLSPALTSPVTPITCGLAVWHCCALLGLNAVAIVPIEGDAGSSPEGRRSIGLGVYMRMMHLCYAAIGFAVARWIFKRQALAVADPVKQFRSQGLL